MHKTPLKISIFGFYLTEDIICCKKCHKYSTSQNEVLAEHSITINYRYIFCILYITYVNGCVFLEIASKEVRGCSE